MKKVSSTRVETWTRLYSNDLFDVVPAVIHPFLQEIALYDDRNEELVEKIFADDQNQV